MGEGEEFAPPSLLKQKRPIAPRAPACYREEAGRRGRPVWQPGLHPQHTHGEENWWIQKSCKRQSPKTRHWPWKVPGLAWCSWTEKNTRTSGRTAWPLSKNVWAKPKPNTPSGCTWQPPSSAGVAPATPSVTKKSGSQRGDRITHTRRRKYEN